MRYACVARNVLEFMTVCWESMQGGGCIAVVHGQCQGRQQHACLRGGGPPRRQAPGASLHDVLRPRSPCSDQAGDGRGLPSRVLPGGHGSLCREGTRGGPEAGVLRLLASASPRIHPAGPPLQTVRDKCFKACITKPSSSLSSSEQQCLARCCDRYAEARRGVVGLGPDARCSPCIAPCRPVPGTMPTA